MAHTHNDFSASSQDKTIGNPVVLSSKPSNRHISIPQDPGKPAPIPGLPTEANRRMYERMGARRNARAKYGRTRLTGGPASRL